MHILKERSLWLLDGEEGGIGAEGEPDDSASLLREPDDEHAGQCNGEAVETEAEGCAIILKRKSVGLAMN